MGRKKTLSLASSVALRVRRAVADESFCWVRLKYWIVYEVSSVSNDETYISAAP